MSGKVAVCGVGESDHSKASGRTTKQIVAQAVERALAVAHLALELERLDESHDAMIGALENARAIVGRSLEELQSDGISIEQLVKDSSPG